MRSETRRQSRERAQVRRKVSKDISTEPPVGGWNTRDAVDDIPPQDAVTLDNFTCGLGAVSVRKGAVPHSYSTSADSHTAEAVRTLAKFEGGGSEQLVAADGGALWVATSPGAKSAVEATGYSSDVWHWTNFNNGSQALLILVNGTEAVQFDGAAFSVLSPALSPAITPVGCATFKNRVYYWEAGSQSVYYTDLLAHAGTLTEFPLGDVGNFGGSLVAVVSWTHDGGHGTDDYILFVMSSGEVLAYQGSYPGDEADWALVGIYNPGRPMGPRSFAKFGGDLFMMTDLDIVPMSQVLAGVEANRQRTKISGAMQRVASFRGSFGFQAELFPPSKLMIFNVPGENVGQFDQFVMNTVTGAWSRWRDRRSYCWLEFDGKLYFGSTNGVVYEAENGFVDHELRIEEPAPPSLPSPSSITVGTPYPYIIDSNDNPNTITPGKCFLEFLPYGSGTWDFEAIFHYTDNNGLNLESIFAAITDGSDLTFRREDLGAIYTFTYDAVGSIFYASSIKMRGNRTAPDPPPPPYAQVGETYEILIDTEAPPTPGEDQEFRQVAIKSLVQTSWLRFGVEENKQFDAVKIFFKSGTTVPHNMTFSTDYAEQREIPYPDPVAAVGVPWSGEWDPSGGIPAEIPDPTTWWTDEGSNPPTPVNDTTGENSVGAITKWGIEAVTTEQWEMINGYGRSVSLLMKMQTTEQTEWNLTFWHLKLGARM